MAIGSGGGYAYTYTDITTSSGARWFRPMAVKNRVLHFNDGLDRWVTCSDTGWIHGGAEVSYLSVAVDYFTQPDCGSGWYSVNATGIWWSYGLDKWFGGTVNSGSLFICPGCGSLVDDPPVEEPPAPPANTDPLPTTLDFLNPTLPEGVTVTEKDAS